MTAVYRAKLLDRFAAALAKTSVNDPLVVAGAAVERVDDDTVDVRFGDGHLVRVRAWALCARCKRNLAIGPQIGAKVERAVCRACHGADLSDQLERSNRAAGWP